MAGRKSVSSAVEPAGTIAPYGSRLIDRYILTEAAGPLTLGLVTVLVALLLERVIRLFGLLASAGRPFDVVLQLAFNLIPHYLGLALPAAFFVSIFVVVARLGDDNEVDALLSSGLSIARVTQPLLLAGCVLALASVILSGFLQPYSRYAYRAVLHAAMHSGWDARVPQMAFVDVSQGLTLTAQDVDPTGRFLEGVFVRRLTDEGEQMTSAASGILGLSPDGTRVVLKLQDGVHIADRKAGAPQLLEFGEMTVDRDFDPAAPPFRPRGDSERELTVPELWRELRSPWSPLSKTELAAELHARLARAASLPLLPLLGVPLGLAAKRGRRMSGLIVATLILLTYHHALQLGESLADKGRFPPVLAVWGPTALFAAFTLWLFSQSQARPGDNSFTRAVAAIDGIMTTVVRRRPKHPA
jgi:lipopolysaccharide export system permease protein